MPLLNVFKTLLGSKREKKSPKGKKSSLKGKKSIHRKKTKNVKKTTFKRKYRRTLPVSNKGKGIALKRKRKTGKSKEVNIGVVTHYFNKISVGIVKLKASLKLGDKIHIKGVHDDFTQTVTSMQFNHKDISSASKGKEIGIKVIQKVHENDKVYKIT